MLSAHEQLGRQEAASQRTLIGHAGPVYACSFSPDSEYLLSCSEDGTTRLWSLQTMSNLVTYVMHADRMR